MVDFLNVLEELFEQSDPILGWLNCVDFIPETVLELSDMLAVGVEFL